MRKSRLLAFVALGLCPLSAGLARAVPPPGAAVSGAQFSLARWIQHRVIPGERLAEIAQRYGVEIANILEWNAIDADKPMLFAGQRLRIYTAAAAAERKRRTYTVREGDSWPKIARRFDVALTRLRDHWNAGHSELRPGDRITVWIEVEPEVEPESKPEPEYASGDAHVPRQGFDMTFELEDDDEPTPQPVAGRARAYALSTPSAGPATATTTTATSTTLAAIIRREPAPPQPQPNRIAPDLPIIPVPQNGVSVGSPVRGRILRSVQLPVNEALYTIRNPDHAWGSSHTVELLQRAIATFRRDSGFDRELLVCDMSRRHGGRFRPHHSHTSGRDIDIQLPTKVGVPKGTVPMALSAVDWDATWALVKALIATQQVKYVFLSRSRQRPLYEAAVRAGATQSELEALIQYPRHSRIAVVRHSRGHNKHLHVRFLCGAHETRCTD